MRRKLSALLIVFGIAFIVAPNAEALTLSVTPVKQEQSLWCWAASTSTVLRYHGVTPTYSQCSLVTIAKGSCPNTTGSITTDLTAIYDHFGRSRGTVGTGLATFSVIQGRINASRPLQVRYAYKPAFDKAHMVTIYGYTGTSTVLWVNPGDGLYNSASWSYLNDNSTWSATHTRMNQGV